MLSVLILQNAVQKRPFLSLYIGGLAATLMYVAALIAAPGGVEIFDGPYGYHNGQYWMNTDAINYVRPAKYFLSHGAFLDYLGGTLTPSHWGVCSPIGPDASDGRLAAKLTPTYHREIGYPLLIALFMKSFGRYWDLALAAFNILAFALVYPFLFLTAKLLFPFNWRTSFVVWPFLFLIVSGTYIIQVPFYLADMTLALFLVMGVYYGLKSQVYLKWTDLCAHVFFLSLAALVKSILVYFVFVDVLILSAFAYYRGTHKQPRSRQFIAISFAVVLLASQFNAYRNFVNHGHFMPTDVLSTNLFCILGKDIAESSGASYLYSDGIRELYKIDSSNVRLIDRMKIEKAREIILQYPVMAGYAVLKNAMSVLYRSHFHLFGRTLVKEPLSPLLWAVLFPLNYFLYTFLYVGFLLFCLRLVRQRKYFFFIAIVSLVGYLLAPTFLGAPGSRMRLPVEGFILIFAFAEVYCRTHLATSEADRSVRAVP